MSVRIKPTRDGSVLGPTEITQKGGRDERFWGLNNAGRLEGNNRRLGNTFHYNKGKMMSLQIFFRKSSIH